MSYIDLVIGYGQFIWHLVSGTFVLGLVVAVIIGIGWLIDRIVKKIHISMEPVRQFEHAARDAFVRLLDSAWTGFRHVVRTVTSWQTTKTVVKVAAGALILVLIWFGAGQILVSMGAPGPGIVYSLVGATFAIPGTLGIALLVSVAQKPRRFPDRYTWGAIFLASLYVVTPMVTLLPLMALD